jgi:hypothetical protein
MHACIDYTRPSLAIGIEQLKNAFLMQKVEVSNVTEVTDYNVVYCKELLKMVNEELRHIEACKIIYSNVKEIVEHQQQYVFDSYWSITIPAERRIREIEEWVAYYEAKVLENKDQIFNHMRFVLKKSYVLVKETNESQFVMS